MSLRASFDAFAFVDWYDIGRAQFNDDFWGRINTSAQVRSISRHYTTQGNCIWLIACDKSSYGSLE